MKKSIKICIGIYSALCFIIAAAAIIAERRTKRKMQRLADELNNIAYVYGDDDYLDRFFFFEEEEIEKD